MPPFTCETAKENDIVIVRSNGYLDEKGGAAVRKAVEEAFEKGFQKFVLNFAGSPVINSPGIAQLLELTEIIVDERKGQLSFVGLNELTMGVFKMVGLLNSGKAFPNEAGALKSFS
jgi:anti-anti-sigma factor